MQTYRLSVLLVLGTLLSQSSATIQCSHTLTGNIPDDVLVDGGSCTLSSASVSGSVTVRAGGKLTTTGETVISGIIQSENSGNIVLYGTTSLQGTLKSLNSPTSTVSIGSGVTVSNIELKNSGVLDVSGTVGTILSEESGTVKINGGTIGGGGIAKKKGSGDISLCGATIGGSISVSELSSGKLLTSSGCGTSTLSGSVLVEKSTVDVNLSEANISSGDVIIVEVTGDITVQSATVSDVTVRSVTGAVRLSGITTDSDVAMTAISESLVMSGCMFNGDMLVSGSQSVNIDECRFSGEDVAITGNFGTLTFSGNEDGDVALTENEDMVISGNNMDTMRVSKNGAVSIVGNTVAQLLCDDNSPPPVGSGNNIQFAQGQCVGF